jgi:predicted TIM-barrel fold metal-dependent hydrolase
MAEKDSIKAYEESRGRILSLYVFDANKGERCIEVMEKYQDRDIFKGIKFASCIDLVNMDDERYGIMWEYARKKGLVILAHTWDLSTTNPGQKYAFPTLLEGYLEKYPEVQVVMGHSAGRYEAIRQAVRIGKKHKNAYFDTSGDVYANHFIEYMVKELGSDRILYGSDYGMMDMRNELGMVLGAYIPIEDKENILFRNAAALWGIELEGEV